MSFVYTIFLHLYYIGIRLFSLTNDKANLWLNGRNEQKTRLKQIAIKNCFWFHTSSLGEFEQVSYVIETIKLKYPKEKILVTFFSPSGFEMKKNFKFADEVLYLPFDFQNTINSFISIVQPKLVFWVRYEFWLNALEKIKSENIPLILLNGVFRNKITLLYKPYLKKCLRCFSEITVINSSSQNNLNLLGFSSKIIYDTRYSRMNQVLQMPFEDNAIQHFCNHDKIIVCGSIWSSDDKVLEQSIKKHNDIRWLLVPHEVDSSRIEELRTLYPNAQIHSKYDKSKINNILIIDSIGFLSRIYRFADLAYVGGGFNKVVHSLIEPLAYSLPIIIGPHIEKSEEAKEFVRLNFAHQVTSSSEFEREMSLMLDSDNSISRQDKHNFFKEKIGSIDEIIQLVAKYASLNN